jgi:hypothetical protein
MNGGIRDCEASGEELLQGIAPWSTGQELSGDPIQSMMYSELLEEVLRNWQKLGDVFRGVELDEAAVEGYEELVGKVTQLSGFVSTSFSRRVAERFGNVLMVIHSKGRPCFSDAAAIPSEREVLFRRDKGVFLIESVKRQCGKWVIE